MRPLRCQLKAFFRDKEDDSNTSEKDIFETLQTRKSKWTPSEGQFASLDFFINECRHDINKLNFNGNTKFSNLPKFLLVSDHKQFLGQKFGIFFFFRLQ